MDGWIRLNGRVDKRGRKEEFDKWKYELINERYLYYAHKQILFSKLQTVVRLNCMYIIAGKVFQPKRLKRRNLKKFRLERESNAPTN